MFDYDTKIKEYMRHCRENGKVPSKIECAEYIGKSRAMLYKYLNKANIDHWVKLLNER
jgi:predicted DNA-binding transcriptional regulator AlpA